MHPLNPLPIDAILDDLRAALHQGHGVLHAPTGSGKSTRVPLALLDESWLAGQRILMLQPRRPAARMTAARLADQLGEPLGERVGYQIRFERRIGPRTRIEVVTEGILTRRLQNDPTLDGVGLVIFDEFHERGLASDLGLALTLDSARGLRPDLRLLVMSATLEAEPVAELLGNARILRAEGRSFPVEIRYAERTPDSDPVRALVAGARQALAEETGDILAFLPGAREIERVREALDAHAGSEVEILPLHGALSSAEQDRALRPDGSGRRRLILATDLAETSLTIEGIRVVLDSGLTRKPRFDPGSGLTRLVTESIPRASADQRAGRAGRLAPGVCRRLWTRAQEVGRPDRRTPEILESDLAPLALELALWGVKDPAELSWLDPPPAPAWNQALELLRTLGALDRRDSITPLGRALAELPVHPRLGVMLLSATPEEQQTAADLCALISERDPFLPEPGRARPADLGLRLEALRAMRERRGTPVGVDRRRLDAIERTARQLHRLAERAASSRRSTCQSQGERRSRPPARPRLSGSRRPTTRRSRRTLSAGGRNRR
jgi:ATP-dependent helicase HrpB